MKYFVAIVFIYFLLFMSSCLANKRRDNKCLPATILVVYLGDENKPTYPLVIKTNENDTSYYKFLGGGKEKFDKYGFDISANYIRSSTVSNETYDLLKNYITNHNTHVDRNLHSAKMNSMKIILSDHCTFLMYTVDETEKRYFSNMSDTLKLVGNDELKKFRHKHKSIHKGSHLLRCFIALAA